MERSADWYVTNGETVVGPVDTNLLLRGVAFGQVGQGCFVWRKGWEDWRDVTAVREVCALRRTQAQRGPEWVPTRAYDPELPHGFAVARAERWMDGACDESEVVALMLQALVFETRAAIGLAHRPRGPLGELETRAAFGVGAQARLGEVLAPNDAAVRKARFGPTIFDAEIGSAESEVAGSRLSVRAAVRGVALAPVYARGRLFAVLEVGKCDRPFRRSDGAWLRAVSRAAAARLAS
jgi:hypothetical protein